MATATGNILVVDDEPDIRDSVADILNSFGYKADTAGDGAEALSRIRDHSYDVALLDFRMPGMDGLTLYREMQQVCPEISAILITAFVSDGIAEEAINRGVRKVISKPVDMGEVIAQVDLELERPLALIVDDNSDFCESLRDVLVEQGLRVGFASNESTATRLVESRHPHVVILDIVLEDGSNAARVFKAIRESSPDAGVILVTGHRSESAQLIDELVNDGEAAVCYKPLELPCLLEAIEHLV